MSLHTVQHNQGGFCPKCIQSQPEQLDAYIQFLRVNQWWGYYAVEGYWRLSHDYGIRIYRQMSPTYPGWLLESFRLVLWVTAGIFPTGALWFGLETLFFCLLNEIRSLRSMAGKSLNGAGGDSLRPVTNSLYFWRSPCCPQADNFNLSSTCRCDLYTILPFYNVNRQNKHQCRALRSRWRR